MDMPGHSQMFRKGAQREMSDEKATKALVALIKELCSLVPKEKMPIIHIGTDEVRGRDEQVNNEILKEYINAVESCGRIPMRWQPGLTPKGYNGSIQRYGPAARTAARGLPTERSTLIPWKLT